MNQITVRGFSDDLDATVRRLAQRESISLNQAALRLMRKGAGLSEAAMADDMIGSSLDHLIGTWTEAQADELDTALQDFEVIDEAAWQ